MTEEQIKEYLARFESLFRDTVDTAYRPGVLDPSDQWFVVACVAIGMTAEAFRHYPTHSKIEEKLKRIM